MGGWGGGDVADAVAAAAAGAPVAVSVITPAGARERERAGDAEDTADAGTADALLPLLLLLPVESHAALEETEAEDDAVDASQSHAAAAGCSSASMWHTDANTAACVAASIAANKSLAPAPMRPSGGGIAVLATRAHTCRRSPCRDSTAAMHEAIEDMGVLDDTEAIEEIGARDTGASESQLLLLLLPL